MARASAEKRSSYLPLSTTGSPRVSTPRICWTRRLCLQRWGSLKFRCRFSAPPTTDPLFLDMIGPRGRWSAPSVTQPEETAVVDVASWLRDLGLERYEAAFRENDV